ncbi:MULTISPECIES: bifunctional phosphopantothenoylcysteine decarboxylase/phosphopantothenate--cysteine ligase CoaBC [Calditerrivibrio]|uniref:bifunctional phosphopantothenoylcysteine decarboxylase/phosphopantothenate--cysteine ligase CoaBC n=1 Tax=Calditerrivibrio TaxID=545865 RepID=UPI003C7141B8
MSNILIGITGGIAAYKIPQLCRHFLLNGHNVKVIMTENAAKFISPLTFESLTGNRVYIDDFEIYIEPENIKHISLSEWADIFIIAPASANTIGKMANGIADNLLTSSILAYDSAKPIVVAPAMNSKMYKNKIFQRNLEVLKENGFHIIEPITGILACKDEGVGKMVEPEDIYLYCKQFLKKSDMLKGKRVLVTAGPTIEHIDPVRFISNRSSGKMGFAIAESAFENGADVTLISGPTLLKTFVQKKEVSSADEMYWEVMNRINDIDILIMAAAVADYKVENYSEEKIKKSSENLTLKLVKNKDILKEASKFKRDNQIFVGFAAESHNVEKNAINKMKEKKLDLIVANDISRKDIGFDSNDNEVNIYFNSGDKIKIDKMDKKKVADKIIKIISDLIIR